MELEFDSGIMTPSSELFQTFPWKRVDCSCYHLLKFQSFHVGLQLIALEYSPK